MGAPAKYHLIIYFLLGYSTSYVQKKGYGKTTAWVYKKHTERALKKFQEEMNGHGSRV